VWAAEGFITMKATDLLKKQHKEVKGLFKKIEGTEDARQRRRLLDEIARSLEGHTVIEEEIFYPAVRGLATRKAEEMVLEAYEEHHVVKLVLAEMPRVNPEDERFEAKMTVLSELVEHHAEEEEKEMFKLAQKLGKDELEALGEQMAERFEAFRPGASEAA
jgi:Hemerythrin HHE cation binding domain